MCVAANADSACCRLVVAAPAVAAPLATAVAAWRGGAAASAGGAAVGPAGDAQRAAQRPEGGGPHAHLFCRRGRSQVQQALQVPRISAINQRRSRAAGRGVESGCRCPQVCAFTLLCWDPLLHPHLSLCATPRPRPSPAPPPPRPTWMRRSATDCCTCCCRRLAEAARRRPRPALPSLPPGEVEASLSSSLESGAGERLQGPVGEGGPWCGGGERLGGDAPAGPGRWTGGGKLWLLAQLQAQHLRSRFRTRLPRQTQHALAPAAAMCLLLSCCLLLPLVAAWKSISGC